MLSAIHQAWLRRKLKKPQFGTLFEPKFDNEVVCFDCETSGLNPKKDLIVSLSAIRIRGHEILTSQSLNLIFKQTHAISPQSIVVHQIRNIDAEQGLDPQEAITEFLNFIGSRPLVGYYLEFDIAMVNNLIRPWLGISLPNKKIDVSELYYKQFYKSPRAQQAQRLDLRFQTIMQRLDLPIMGQHNAFNDALMTAMIYVKLQQMAQQP